MRLRAHAKVNLGLRVTGRRGDGYHELDTLMVSVDLHDVVTVEPASGGSTITISGPEGQGVPADAGNLAWRAARDAAVTIAVEKHIPSRAGLGGASADAAAVLYALGRADDLAGAAALGADVPFCLRGGAARARGAGDVLEPAAVPADVWLVLVVPAVRLSTAAVYAEWDDGGPGDEVAIAVPGVGDVVNDLTGPATRLAPELAATFIALERRTGRPWVMTGSGSGLLLPLDDGDLAADVAVKVGGSILRPVARGVEVMA